MFSLLMACGGVPSVTDATQGADASVVADASAPNAKPDYCFPTEAGLQRVTTTPASPYFVKHPEAGTTPVHTVLFLPGGPGTSDVAQITFDDWLAEGGDRMKAMRVIVPYTAGASFGQRDADRGVAIVDEMLACFGGDPAHVHLGGTSNGGRAAFALMLRHGDRFATLLGAPGVFDGVSDSQLKTGLAGKAIYNGVGELDTGWKANVTATHDRLTTLGLASELHILQGQDHILTPEFDESVFYAFWSGH